MSLKLRPWGHDAPLTQARVTVLEASAGTGKTWQIEALVVRLIAEEGIAISRLLVITFTEAATAELRDKIRRRLSAARDALASDDAPVGDPVIADLWKRERSVRLERVRTALTDFDEAAISTIHGFCQRMLTRLAFESGVEPDLVLLTDTAPLRQRLVADELAKVFARATRTDLRLLASMRWKKTALAEVTKEMTGAVAPRVVPDVAEDALGFTDPLESVGAWRAALADYSAWLAGPSGVACVAALRANSVADTKRDPKHYSGYKPAKHDDVMKGVAAWLTRDALGDPDGVGETALAWLTLERLTEKWGGGDAALQALAALPLFERTSALLALRGRLWEAPLVGYAKRVRARFEAELGASGSLTFDGMLSRLGERVAGETHTGPLATAIRDRYDVALVDEFQDTDAAQWSVLRNAFSLAADRRLFLIGDPKQSIYLFRGADLDVYLGAAHEADGHFTLDRNFRSDEPLVRAMNHTWQAGTHPFGANAGIDYVEVSAQHAGERLAKLPPVERESGAEARRAFEVRWFDAETFARRDGRMAKAAGVLHFAAERAALECARLLAGEVTRAEDGSTRPLHAGDIAILVRAHRQGVAMREALRKRGIPTVGGGRRTLWDSDALRWLCTWLDAVGAPDDERAARAFAVTPLVGWTAAQLARALEPTEVSSAQEADDPRASEAAADAWRRLRASLTRAATRFGRQGFFRAFHAMLGERESLTRVLRMPGGERAATDLRHLAEIAHLEERRARLSPRGLGDWLRSQADDAEAEAKHPLRLESDARAVKIVTIHSCKGLQYPITLLPFAGVARLSNAGTPGIRVRLPARSKRTGDAAGELCLVLSASDSPEREEAKDAFNEDAHSEAMRLLYVALTRAEHHIVAWTGAHDAAGHGLNGLVLRDEGVNGASNARAAVGEAEARLDALAARSGGTIGWAREPVVAEVVGSALAVSSSTAPLVARPWDAERALGSGWQVASFSSLTNGLGHASAASPAEGEAAPASSEAAVSSAGLGGWPAFDDALGAPVAADVLPKGKEAGKWVHAVFEHLDFERGAPRASTPAEGASALPGMLADLRAKEGVAASVYGAPAGEDADSLLAAALPRWLDTPLGGADTGLAPGFRLRDLRLSRRLDELHFDLSLVDGAGRSGPGRIVDDAVRAALEPRRADATFPGRAWLDALFTRSTADGAGLAHILPAITGILTGSIDLVFRASDDGRFYLADYKTNRLSSPPGADGQRLPSRLGNYTDAWLARAMGDANYHLQALLYTVALHRWLGARLGTSYRYDTHVGGHLYLFLRGMEGEQTPLQASGRRLGVYFDRWPRAVIEGLDLALRGASAESVTQHLQSLAAETGR